MISSCKLLIFVCRSFICLLSFSVFVLLFILPSFDDEELDFLEPRFIFDLVVNFL